MQSTRSWVRPQGRLRETTGEAVRNSPTRYFVVVVLAVALSLASFGDVSASAPPPSPLPPEDLAAVETGYIARCNDGQYSDNTDFWATCSSHDGIRYWLASYGQCAEPEVIVMSSGSACRDFKSLLPADFVPQPGPLDVARCNNGLYSDNTDFAATCSANGGMAAWLAQEGVCRDGFVFVMSEDAGCDDHGGFEGLRIVAEATTASSTLPATQVVSAPIGFPIEVGSNGPAVAAVQARVGANVDCAYGDQTRRAVEAWQRNHERPVTGIIDLWDWSLLEVPALWGNDADGNGLIGPLEEITLVCGGDVELPAWPLVSPNALQFLDLDECHIYETSDAGDVEWYECTRVDPLDDQAVGYITPGSDVVAAWEWAQNVPGFNEFEAVLLTIDGGGVFYLHSGDWEMFDVAPFTGFSGVVDTYCAPFPDPNPDLCVA